MFTPGHPYAIRSGSLRAFDNDGVRLLPVGTRLVFSHHNSDPPAYIVHPHEAKKYRVFVFRHEGADVHIPLPIMKVYPDKDDKETWMDNAPALMFQPLAVPQVMRVLFLDIDGVLNTDPFLQDQQNSGTLLRCKHDKLEWFGAQIHPGLRDNLHQLVAAVPGIHVVVHSTWRYGLSKNELEFVLRTPIYDIAPKALPGQKMSEYPPRGAYIAAWMEANAHLGNLKFAIVDDEAGAADTFTNHRLVRGTFSREYVATNGTTGLTEAVVAEILAKLA